MSPPDKINDVCAILVTYHPEIDVEKRIYSILNQVGMVIIIDNTPKEKTPAWLSESENREGITFLQNGRNLGIAEALNIGFDKASDLGYEWALTLDQDSNPDGCMVLKLYKTALELSQHMDIGTICPVIQDERTDRFTKYFDYPIPTPMAERLNRNHRAIYTCITSGSLVPVKVIRQIGGFRKEYFIDYVDTEICLRMLKNNFFVIQDTDTVLPHSIGDMTSHSLFGRIFSTTNHLPKRRYYYFRNRIFVWKAYYRDFAWWVRKDILIYLKAIVKIILYEKNKLKNLSTFFRGMSDGIRGVTGEL